MVEVIVAMAILMVIVSSLMALYYHITVVSVRTARISVAHVTAQLVFESMVGRTDAGINGEVNTHLRRHAPPGVILVHEGSNYFVRRHGEDGLPYRVVINRLSTEDGFPLPDGLIEVIITVYESLTPANTGVNRLHRHNGIINTLPGGIIGTTLPGGA